ncbi:MAG: NAD(P)H-hydrate dehydratase [Gemmatimonadota bacterium]
MTRPHIYGREDVHALTAFEATAWDRTAREQHDIPERVLMENAGRAVAAVIHRLYPRGRVVALVGSGHNGADALIALRALHGWGRDVSWLPAGARSDDAVVLHDWPIPAAQPAALNQAAVLIDGALGTGTRGPAREPVAASLRLLNETGLPIVAVDLPSGVDATTGAVEGEAIHAQVTVTFGAAKVGLLLHPARAHCGRLLVAEIGFPPLTQVPSAQLITPAWAHARLPRRSPTAHKGSSGRLLLLAGSYGMAGAAALAGQAALRAGAGLLRIVSTIDNREILQTLVPEATFFDHTDELPIGGIHAFVAGCGLSTEEEARAVLERALDATGTIPVVLDADALNLFTDRGAALTRLAASRPVVLTPHIRELARISGLDETGILRDPIGSARGFAQQTNAVVLLKGQPSVVAALGEPVLINTTGSSDVATGGMGDQLAGMIGAFLAAGAPPRAAAALALFYGGRAADLARCGRSLSPQDVTATLHRAFRFPGARRSKLGLPFITFDQPPRW